MFDVFIGQHAPILSGLLGLVGSACLAIPPIKSWGIRNAALTLDRLKTSERFGRIAERASAVATENLLAELRLERGFNLAGAVLLFLSFLLLILHAVWEQGL